MPSLLSLSLLVASVSAQVTTSVWFPGVSETEHIGYVASVIARSGDKTTLAVKFDDKTNTTSLFAEENGPETITLAPNAWQVLTTTTFTGSGDYTNLAACSKGPDNAICTASSNGGFAWSELCRDHTETGNQVTRTYLYTDRFSSVESVTVSYNPLSNSYADFCKSSGTTLPESAAISVMTVGLSRIQAYPIVITAGLEKLEATAGASPSTTGASVTGRPTGSQTTNAPAQQSTGAAAGGKIAPAFVGLGAAMAAYML